ncbi:unnamed protein product [Closterium sp. NIES-65]|nr:unnamed protein product [Closterium sp. NIES-65]
MDPMTGLGTDKIRGVVVLHPWDTYRWRQVLEDPLVQKKYLVRGLPLGGRAGQEDPSGPGGADLDGSVVAVPPAARAGGVAIVSLKREVTLTDFPSNPTARGPFFRDVRQPFIAAIPSGSHLMLAGDLNKVSSIIRNHEEQGGDLEALTNSLKVGLKAYTVEERKRVAATTTHLEREEGELRQKVMSKPWCTRAKARLVKYEAKLKAYDDGRQQKLQEQAGIKVEMNSEAPTGFLLAKVKARKAKTRLEAVNFRGQHFVGSKEALKVAASFYADLFDDKSRPGALSLDFKMDRQFSPKDAAVRSARWEEEEVKQALAEMVSGKTPGIDGLPKEFWGSQWSLLGGHVMKFLKDFERTASLAAEVSMAVTVLVHKKGDKEDLQNYRPINLLSTAYKIIAKILAIRIKHRLEKVVSTGPFGFLPSRSLAGAVAIAADAIDAANSMQKDWLLLLVDFRKAFDSVSRDYLFEVLGKMGFPRAYVKWVEGLHRRVAKRICNDGWLGEEVPVQTGVRQGCPLAPYLFFCAVEPLCQEAQWRQLGVDIADAGKLSYLGYADDTTLLLKGREQLNRAETLLRACYTSFYAHEGLLKMWDGGSERWKAIAVVVMESPIARNLPCKSRRDVEKERVVFNRHILREGSCPFGRRKGSECLWDITVGDLVMKWVESTRSPKTPVQLERLLGSKQAAALAAEVFEAILAKWKNQVLKTLSEEEMLEAIKVVCAAGRGVQMWWIVKASGSALWCVKMRRRADGVSWYAPEGARVSLLPVWDATLLAMLGDEVA